MVNFPSLHLWHTHNVKTAPFFLSIGVVVLAGCSDTPDRPEAKQPPRDSDALAAVERVAETNQVIAYYFHGTVRCETCLQIENQAKELVSNRFATEVASGQLVFKPVNYDEPENAHFQEEYKLPCPSLVLVRQKGGKNEEWTLLDRTWEHVEDPVKFNEYVEGAVKGFLTEAE
jgi:hypothetical protein